MECSKLTCSAKVKKIGMVPGQRDRRSKLAAVSHRSRTAMQRLDLGKGKNRSKATYPH